MVEATASYEWFAKLVEPLSTRVVLAHLQRMRGIAELTHKSDKTFAVDSDGSGLATGALLAPLEIFTSNRRNG